MAVTQRRMTLEKFLELPEEKPALEYFEGRITQKVPPKLRHSALQLEVAKLIDSFARPLKLARAFPELRTTLSSRSALGFDMSILVVLSGPS